MGRDKGVFQQFRQMSDRFAKFTRYGRRYYRPNRRGQMVAMP